MTSRRTECRLMERPQIQQEWLRLSAAFAIFPSTFYFTVSLLSWKVQCSNSFHSLYEVRWWFASARNYQETTETLRLSKTPRKMRHVWQNVDGGVHCARKSNLTMSPGLLRTELYRYIRGSRLTSGDKWTRLTFQWKAGFSRMRYFPRKCWLMYLNLVVIVSLHVR